MKNFVQTSHNYENLPGLLQIYSDGHLYRLRIEHASLKQRNSFRKLSKANMHSHSVYHLLLYIEGDNYICCGKTEVRVSPGTLVLIPPGLEHSVGPLREGTVVYSEVTFSLIDSGGRASLRPFQDILSGYLGVKVRLPSILVIGSKSCREGLVLWDELLEILAVGGSNLGRAYSSFLNLLIWVADFAAEAEDEGLEKNSVVAKARRYIEDHFTDSIRVGELAESCRLSRSHFLRVFRQEYSVSPIEFQQRLKIEAAKNLLLTTNLLGKEIASRVGFSDEYSFSRTFRRRTGINAGEFRRRGVYH